MINNRKPAICIDFKTKKRIRIHKSTLHLLGDPEYIQLLINPSDKTIAVKRGLKNDPLAHKVYKNKNERTCFELCSTGLLRSLRQLYEDWEDGRSYRINGQMNTDNEIVLFRIKDMVRI